MLPDKAEGKIVTLPLEEEIKNSYLDYAMSVIVGRAIPDVRDGLKPVHRRILYSMLELGLRHNQPFKKCARVVGETMGKYHPHGDSAIYEALVRMAQDFSTRYVLVDGQGNFGSIDGDPPAAMRYTECRLSEFGEYMLADIYEDTVDWMPNFDESLKEPMVLPSAVPNLLVNGSSGIAVGMATNIPPHNLAEIVDGLLFLIDNPDATVEQLMHFIPGPDFPTGGIICGKSGIKEAYVTGKGRIVLRGVTKIQEIKKGKKAIVITEIPYMISKSNLIETIIRRVKEQQLTGISDIRDESDKEGMRLVIELQRDADPDVVLNQLYSRTQLEVTYGVNSLALVDGTPKMLSLKEMMQCYIDHRRNVIRRRTQFRLQKAKERAHILEGLKIALNNIDLVISIIKSSKDVPQARTRLIEALNITEKQAQAILDMKLQRLTSLEREKLDKELATLLQDIERYETILSVSAVLDGEVKKELIEVRQKFADKRKTKIVEELLRPTLEDLIPDEEVVVILTKSGYIKSVSLQDYRKYSRGTKGNKLSKEEIAIVVASTLHSSLYLFTSFGRAFTLKCYELARGVKIKGKPIAKLIPLVEGETIVEMRSFDLERANYVIFFTANGYAKRMEISELEGITRGGRRVIQLSAGDSISAVKFTTGKNEIVVAAGSGRVLRFSEQELRPQGRTARGVKAMNLKGYRLVGAEVLREGKNLLFVSTNGFGKRTNPTEFGVYHRGSAGVIGIRLKKDAYLVGVWAVSEDDEVLISTSSGRVNRLQAKDIPVLSRNAYGCRLIRLDEKDTVTDVSIIRKEV